MEEDIEIKQEKQILNIQSAMYIEKKAA